MIAPLAVPLAQLRRLPGIWYVAAVVLVFLCAAMYGLGASAKEAKLLSQVRKADSTAVANYFTAQLYKAQAKRAKERAAEDRRFADSTAAAAAIARSDVASRVAKAARSRATVDTAGLPATVIAALADADSLRLAVTPAFAKDSAAIAGYQRTIVDLNEAIALGDTALAKMTDAYDARGTEIDALKQMHAPRCGMKCGVVIGATGVLAAVTAVLVTVRSVLP